MSTTTLATGKPSISWRWLVLCTCAVAVLVGGLAIGDYILRQRATLQKIRFFGGNISFRPTGPEWLREWIGREAFEYVDPIREINFMPDSATFDSRFSGNGCFAIHPGPSIDDSTLACISSCESLENLDLAYNNVSDAGLQHIANLRNLKSLNLRGTDVTDVSVPMLVKFEKLEHLYVDNTRISKTTELLRALPGCRVNGWQRW